MVSQTRGAFALFCLFLHYYVHHTLISQFLHATIVGREVRYDIVDILAGAQIQSPIPVVHGLSIASASSMSAATNRQGSHRILDIESIEEACELHISPQHAQMLPHAL